MPNLDEVKETVAPVKATKAKAAPTPKPAPKAEAAPAPKAEDRLQNLMI